MGQRALGVKLCSSKEIMRMSFRYRAFLVVFVALQAAGCLSIPLSPSSESTSTDDLSSGVSNALTLPSTNEGSGESSERVDPDRPCQDDDTRGMCQRSLHHY